MFLLSKSILKAEIQNPYVAWRKKNDYSKI